MDPLPSFLLLTSWKAYDSEKMIEDFISRAVPRFQFSGQACWIAVPFAYIKSLTAKINYPQIVLGARHMHSANAGDFTESIAGKMLSKSGAKFVLIGSFEDRQHFSEDNATINCKVKKSLKASVTPILCVGESLEERHAGKGEEVIAVQLREGLTGLSPDQLSKVAVLFQSPWEEQEPFPLPAERVLESYESYKKILLEVLGPADSQAVTVLFSLPHDMEDYGGALTYPSIRGLYVGNHDFLSTFLNIYEPLTQAASVESERPAVEGIEKKEQEKKVSASAVAEVETGQEKGGAKAEGPKPGPVAASAGGAAEAAASFTGILPANVHESPPLPGDRQVEKPGGKLKEEAALEAENLPPQKKAPEADADEAVSFAGSLPVNVYESSDLPEDNLAEEEGDKLQEEAVLEKENLPPKKNEPGVAAEEMEAKIAEVQETDSALEAVREQMLQIGENLQSSRKQFDSLMEKMLAEISRLPSEIAEAIKRGDADYFQSDPDRIDQARDALLVIQKLNDLVEESGRLPFRLENLRSQSHELLNKLELAWEFFNSHRREIKQEFPALPFPPTPKQLSKQDPKIDLEGAKISAKIPFAGKKIRLVQTED